MILKKLLMIFVYLESKCSKGDSSVSMGLRNSKLYDITRTAIYRNGQSHDYMLYSKGHVTYKNTRDDECYDDCMICIWPLITMRGMTSETRGKDNVS
jgi:hypothetical protein